MHFRLMAISKGNSLLKYFHPEITLKLFANVPYLGVGVELVDEEIVVSQLGLLLGELGRGLLHTLLVRQKCALLIRGCQNLALRSH